MAIIIKDCLNCERKFSALTSEVNRGNAKFCSRACSYIYNAKEKIKKNEAKKIPNISCTYCNKLFFIPSKRIKASKTQTFFCCRNHKDLALRKESNINLALPTHYKQDYISDYRLVYLRAKKIICCENCGYSKYIEVLEVHHKDRDRTNNNLENLIALCPTCHVEEHFINGDGRWSRNNSKNNNLFQYSH